MRFVIGTVTMALCCGFAGAQVWYVDVNNATRGQDGMTWSTAFTTIQPAIDAAYNAGGGEVWVAEGTYGEPRTSLVNAVETGSLVMREEVDLYGGFNGSEETRDQRDWSANDTVIDGTNSREGEPAHHVVLGADNAKIDGFTITGGDAKNRSGGGMYNSRVSPTVINCTIADNRSTRGGGGVLNTDSCAQFFNCLFYSNFTTSMGGAASTYGGPSYLSIVNFVRMRCIHHRVAWAERFISGMDLTKSRSVVLQIMQ